MQMMELLQELLQKKCRQKRKLSKEYSQKKKFFCEQCCFYCQNN